MKIYIDNSALKSLQYDLEHPSINQYGYSYFVANTDQFLPLPTSSLLKNSASCLNIKNELLAIAHGLGITNMKLIVVSFTSFDGLFLTRDST